MRSLAADTFIILTVCLDYTMLDLESAVDISMPIIRCQSASLQILFLGMHQNGKMLTLNLQQWQK